MTRRTFPPKTPCVDCGNPSSGTRCRGCYVRNLPPRQRLGRPGYTKRERLRRKATVDAWRAEFGEVCPGYQRPAHDVVAPNRLTADHVLPYAAGGDEDGELGVLCQSCNSAKRDGRPAQWARRRSAPAEWTVQPRIDLPAGEDKHQEVAPVAKAPRLHAVPEPAPDAPRPIPAPPAGVGPEAAALWRDTLAQLDMEPHELAAFVELVRTQDMIARLQEIVDRDGLMVPVLPHGEKVNPAAVELRQSRMLFARQQAALRLPQGEADEDGLKRAQRRSGFRGPYGLAGGS